MYKLEDAAECMITSANRDIMTSPVCGPLFPSLGPAKSSNTGLDGMEREDAFVLLLDDSGNA